VPATSACSSKDIFVVATNSINEDKQARQYVPIISLFFKYVYGINLTFKDKSITDKMTKLIEKNSTHVQTITQ
jgi:hypothetical protein